MDFAITLPTLPPRAKLRLVPVIWITRGHMLVGVTSMPVRGLRLSSHVFAVPLDHHNPDGDQIKVFVREVSAPDGTSRPPLLFLQGGPGFESPRPSANNPAWLHRALQDFRVFFLDQRGTGLSSPLGYEATRDPIRLAQRLVHFRADSIVADAEWIREKLKIEQWSLLGQSFGGFVALHYLSQHPDSLKEVLFAGGLPPVNRGVDEIYAATHAEVSRRTHAFFARFPDARTRFGRALEACESGRVTLPTGETLTPHRLRSVGHLLGTTAGEQINYLLEHEPDSLVFGHDVATLMPFQGRNPIYAVLHEACYANGGVTNWSAQRTLPDHPAQETTWLTGEHLFPWHFVENPTLRAFEDTAQWLAEHPWPTLYDVESLSTCQVPCAAAIYAEDPFVIREFSEETAQLIPGLKPWTTNEYQHSGLRTSGNKVLDRLIKLARDLVD